MSSRATTALRTFNSSCDALPEPLHSERSAAIYWRNASIILRHADVGAGAADRRNAGQDREPARDLIFDARRRIALAVSDDLHEQFPAKIFARRDGRLLARRDIGRNDAQAVEADGAAHGVDRVERTAARLQRGNRRGQL